MNPLCEVTDFSVEVFIVVDMAAGAGKDVTSGG